MSMELVMALVMRSFVTTLCLSAVLALLRDFLFVPPFIFIVSYWNLSAVAP